MSNKHSVLIVDRSDDAREVLRTALERLGMSILEARGADEGLELARHHHPNLIVLDLEADSESNNEVFGRFANESCDSEQALLVLGTAHRQSIYSDRSSLDNRFIAKPYHYRALVRKIEDLLAR